MKNNEKGFGVQGFITTVLVIFVGYFFVPAFFGAFAESVKENGFGQSVIWFSVLAIFGGGGIFLKFAIAWWFGTEMIRAGVEKAQGYDQSTENIKKKYRPKDGKIVEMDEEEREKVNTVMGGYYQHKRLNSEYTHGDFKNWLIAEEVSPDAIESIMEIVTKHDKTTSTTGHFGDIKEM